MRNTTLCYIERDGQYLMLHRVKKTVDENRDKWIGIGGRSWRYRAIVTFVSDEWGTEYMHLFSSDDFRGQLLTDCDEGELAWIGKKELLEKPIWEGDRIFLRLLEEGEPFFSLKLRYRGDRLTEAVLNGQPLL